MAGPALFSPFSIRELTLRNRVVLTPMCQYLAVEGIVQDWHLVHHAGFALGGLGAAFVEATGVTRNGRITHGCTGIWSNDHVPGLRRIVDIYHDQGAACGIQLGHAGRRASALRPWDSARPIETTTGDEAAWDRIGPSAIPERPGYPAPREMTAAEIEDTIDAFVAATERALAAGFDIVELHGAHGYLLHSFLSPLANHRTDAYGGSLENRMRLPLEVARAVRAAWPVGKPLFYRVSAIDGVEGGLEIGDTITLARELKSAGVDVVDCSSGGISGPATLSDKTLRPGYQVPYSEAVRRQADIATMAVGAIIAPAQAEAILRDGRADLIAIGRELMADPYWVYRAALELGLPDPHDVLPWQYAFYLKRRAAVLDRNAEPA